MRSSAMRFVLIGWVSVIMVCGTAAAQTVAPEPDTSAPPAVAVKRTEPTGIVFVQHVGAYWSVGPKLSRLREYMLQADGPGPMFVRFQDSPTSVPPGSLRAQIGFFATPDHHPQPPYRTATRDAELIAYMSVDPGTARPVRYLSVMYQWIEDHGYNPVGPVTEVYSVDSDGDEIDQRVELQMTIEPAKPKPAEQPSDAVRVETEHVESTDREPTPVGSAPTDEADLWKRRVQEWVRQRAATNAAAKIRDGDNVAETLLPSIAGPARTDTPDEPAGPDLTKATDAEPNVATPAEVPPRRAAAPVPPVSQLLLQRRFEEIAEQLLPPAEATPPSLQVWLGQVVYRLSAVAKGIKQVYPGEDELIFALVDAITRRYAEVSAGSSIDPLEQPVVYVDSESDPLAAEKRAIMRQLDSLLGRIALRSVDVTATLNHLETILQRSCDLARQP